MISRFSYFILVAVFCGAIAVFAGATISEPAFAHGGGLNAEGCHNDRRRGTYHCHRSPSKPAPRPARVIAPTVYANCDTVRAAGAAPIYRGQAGYGSHLDRDGDGVGCEASGGSTSRGADVPVRAAASVAIAPVAADAQQSLAVPIEGKPQILDGDTVQIGLTRIRLFGIDAFESEQLCVDSSGATYACGGRATRALAERIGEETIACTPKGSDAFGRQLAICRVDATDIGSWMVRHGHALAYSKYALDYLPDERHAKNRRNGAWGGSFDLPWEYRLTRPGAAAEAQRTATAPSANCSIKGNVNKQGERSYYLPSDPAYSRIRAENWFCSIAEADKAGFRRGGFER
jgi:endonuclease YncB( thermonuclease family)